MTGGFWPLVGPSAGGSFHLLEESGLQQSVQREDSSSGWTNRDDERLVWARIVPVSGGFGTVDGGFWDCGWLVGGKNPPVSGGICPVKQRLASFCSSGWGIWDSDRAGVLVRQAVAVSVWGCRAACSVGLPGELGLWWGGRAGVWWGCRARRNGRALVTQTR